MKKKKTTKTVQAAKENKVKPVKPAEAQAFDDRDLHDYGGIPDRDLKKNLGGCG